MHFFQQVVDDMLNPHHGQGILQKVPVEQHIRPWRIGVGSRALTKVFPIQLHGIQVMPGWEQALQSHSQMSQTRFSSQVRRYAQEGLQVFQKLRPVWVLQRKSVGQCSSLLS